MAVAAYAYVTSLLHVLDQVQHPFRRRLLPNTKQIEALQEKVHFLQEFLEVHSQGERDHINYLGRQIAEVAYEAEDIIDSHVAVQLRQEHQVIRQENQVSSEECEEYEDPRRKKMTIGSRKRKIYSGTNNEDVIDFHVADHQLRGGSEDETDEDMGLSLLFSEINIGAHAVDHQLHGGSEDEADVVDQLRGGSEDETDEDMGLFLLFSEMNIGAHVADHQLHGGSESTIDIAFSSSYRQDIDKVIEKIESIKKKVDYYVMTVGGWGGFHVGLSNTDPGQCRRTDGKKWWCSRDAVVDKKYCKQHLNRGGRNHSMQTPHSINNNYLPPIAFSMSASVVVVGGVSNNLVSANDHLSGIPNIINRSLVDEEIPKDKLTYSVLEQKPTVSVRAGPSHGKSTRVVGFDDRLIQIMELLTTDQPNLQIIPIVGMGGIGKTTLAQFVFENKYVVEKFDKRVWFTLSQEYSVHEILLGVLRDVGVPGDLENETLAELRLRLHQELSGRRYLIVMDDLWSTNDWYNFKLSFPNNWNGSRVMVTTRLTDVAVSLASYSPYLMDFLDEDKSWNLFCEKTFTQESCSVELEDIGKRIARSCKGLPLAIVVIGGLLAKSDMTREYWESVAGKVNLLVSSENDDDCSKILYLSYCHLPIHLKPCFLYMSFFPEDCEIEVFDLIESWVDEGFLKPIRGKSLEEVANEYLKDLIERNLILILERGDLGDITRCGVHDLLRDLCRRESLKDHFLRVPKSQQIDFHGKGNDESRVLVTSGRVRSTSSKAIVGPRSTELHNPRQGDDPNTHLIRIWLSEMDDDWFYEEFHLYTKLRYLAFSLETYTINRLSLSTISQFWKLQTLCFYVCETLVLPSEIWKMPQLRHVNIEKGCCLPIVTQIERTNFIVLENLHTLSIIYKFRCTKDVIKRIPNLKKLEIEYSYDYNEVDWSNYCLHNIDNLHKLESLVLRYYTSTCENIAFPYSLKKLELYRCIISWEDMTVIASLPNLEVLKLHQKFYHYPWTREWNPVEGGFSQLKFLSLNDTRLEQWRAESTHFPKLEILELQYMISLKEIPRGFGEIETLRKIELYSCSSSVINSAKEIYEEQQSFGNEDFQLNINGFRELGGIGESDLEYCPSVFTFF
ncbi:hypothetical protein BUALT_Bualt07G0030400 [Buddleja alternifolia]|uniref:WRC domain-containing protein n=1 Tax=Buddleja alternifolia TaxID=168488 RepID=A0AAV6XIE6_9LAMI|nr:hypothetical protein BUALT_Bualt07G0030400 [Buddleja alternifolia]